MKTRAIIEGLTILEKYRNKDGFNMNAQHDTIYVYATDRPLSRADLQRLIDLGWFQDGYSGEFTVDDYDGKATWVCFT